MPGYTRKSVRARLKDLRLELGLKLELELELVPVATSRLMASIFSTDETGSFEVFDVGTDSLRSTHTCKITVTKITAVGSTPAL